MPRGDLDRLLRIAGENPAPAPPTGFVENAFAAFDQASLVDLTISRELALHEAYDAYLDEIQQQTGELFENPLVAESLEGVSRETTERRLFEQVTALGLQALTPEQIRARADDISRAAEMRAIDITGRATTAGRFGALAGGIVGALRDPPLAASLLLGAPASFGILRTAATEAAIGAGVEAALQPIVQTERLRLGLEGGFDQAVRNVVFAAAGGAIFGAGFRAAQRLTPAAAGAVRRIRNQIAGEDAPPIQRDAAALQDRLADAEATNPLTPDARGTGEHFRLYDDAMQRLRDPARPPQAELDRGVAARGDLQGLPRLRSSEASARATRETGEAITRVQSLGRRLAEEVMNAPDIAGGRRPKVSPEIVQRRVRRRAPAPPTRAAGSADAELAAELAAGRRAVDPGLLNDAVLEADIRARVQSQTLDSMQLAFADVRFTLEARPRRTVVEELTGQEPDVVRAAEVRQVSPSEVLDDIDKDRAALDAFLDCARP